MKVLCKKDWGRGEILFRKGEYYDARVFQKTDGILYFVTHYEYHYVGAFEETFYKFFFDYSGNRNYKNYKILSDYFITQDEIRKEKIMLINESI